jgi:hypothetical protein
LTQHLGAERVDGSDERLLELLSLWKPSILELRTQPEFHLTCGGMREGNSGNLVQTGASFDRVGDAID